MGLFWGNEAPSPPTDAEKRTRIINSKGYDSTVSGGHSVHEAEFMFYDMYRAIHETNALVKSLIEENTKLRQRMENLEKTSSNNNISRSFHSSRAV